MPPVFACLPRAQVSIAAAAAEVGGLDSLRAYAIAKMVNSPGGPSDDFEAWRDVSEDPDAQAHASGGAGTLFRLSFARTRMAETPGVAPTAVLVLSPILPSDEVALATAGLAYPLLTVVKTSLDVAPLPSEAALVSALVSAVLAEYDAAVALAAEGLLHATHVQARMGGEREDGGGGASPPLAHALPLFPLACCRCCRSCRRGTTCGSRAWSWRQRLAMGGQVVAAPPPSRPSPTRRSTRCSPSCARTGPSARHQAASRRTVGSRGEGRAAAEGGRPPYPRRPPPSPGQATAAAPSGTTTSTGSSSTTSSTPASVGVAVGGEMGRRKH